MWTFRTDFAKLSGMIRALLIVLVLAVAPPLALSAEDPPTVLVTEVIDGDTIRIEPPVLGANEVRLVGTQAPHLPLGRPGYPTWPLAHAARDVLETLSLGQRFRLEWGEHPQDRHGRLLAQAHRTDGVWLQAEMLRRGFARVYSFPDNRAHIEDLLAVERAARAADLGIWSHPYYAVRTPDTVVRDVDTFQIVEGRVIEAKRVKRHVYLNFGDDWRSDFTVAIKTRHLRRFEAAGLAPLALTGRVIRVRGWIRSFNGPLIDATHPEQIEVVNEGASDADHSPCCNSNPRTRAAWNMAR